MTENTEDIKSYPQKFQEYPFESVDNKQGFLYYKSTKKKAKYAKAYGAKPRAYVAG